MTRVQKKILNKKQNSNTSKEGLSWSYKDLSMDDKVYKLRRQVISIIYEVKKLIPDFPRVEVRISEMKNAGGLGYLNNNVIRIGLNAINGSNLRAVVYHELGHAVLGLEHDEECPLMASGTKKLRCQDLCRKHCEQIFLNYWKGAK